MITKEQIARINELAAKARTAEGLTDDEVREREMLRRLYIDAVKQNVRDRLDRVHFVEDLTPEEREKMEKDNETKKGRKN
ncbi:MAG: DUF896 domain-containing protein [Anaerovoracaceae bacterium]|jgi:uncharacterized protein YnzC (UPF0291/DUF896 family)